MFGSDMHMCKSFMDHMQTMCNSCKQARTHTCARKSTQNMLSFNCEHTLLNLTELALDDSIEVVRPCTMHVYKISKPCLAHQRARVYLLPVAGYKADFVGEGAICSRTSALSIPMVGCKAVGCIGGALIEGRAPSTSNGHGPWVKIGALRQP